MIETVTIEKLELTGFRAYLNPKTFSLRDKIPFSLAVFAPNGSGKSSLVDSLEYYFSMEGTLKRLGRNLSPTQAGLSAMRHVDADKRNIETAVHIWFRHGSEKFDDLRQMSDALTDAARRVLDLTKVPFVIRGHELRQFVEGTKPIDRYKELVRWFELDPLLTIQENMLKLKRRVNMMVSDTTGVNERIRDIGRITNGTIQNWDEPSILSWLNAHVLAELDKPLRFKSLSDDDPAFQELVAQETKRKRDDSEVLKPLLTAIDDLHARPADSNKDSTGQIILFERTITSLRIASDIVTDVRTATSNSVFEEVWTSAQKLLTTETELDSCPVCNTKFSSSEFRSSDRVNANIRVNLEKLREYTQAKEKRNTVKTRLNRIAKDLEEALSRFSLLASSTYQYDAVTNYYEVLRSWKAYDDAPDSKDAVDVLAQVRSSIIANIRQSDQQQDKHTYHDALETVRRLLDTKSELERIRRNKDALSVIKQNLDLQSKAFGDAIVDHVQNLIKKLQDETGTIYKAIQGPHVKVPPIRIELAGEGAADSRRAQLLVDFADNKGVIPGGFLSDSQIHTLALALRLAAIRIFNTKVRIIALDDIVTSYDADHRKNIAAMLSDYFGDFQIILVTHDESFFGMLREHLSSSHWRFKQIKELRDNVGPIFDDHRTSEEEIEKKLATGENAATDMRQVEEEWLTRICYEFKTPTTFQRGKYTNSILAESLNKFFKEQHLEPPKVPGNANSFILSLQVSTIENFSSHFNDNIYKSESTGDMQRRWDEFKYFRNLFVCSKCNHSHFKRPKGLNKPVCAKCETQFRFEYLESS